MGNALQEVREKIAELGAGLEKFAIELGINFEGSTSINKRLMLAAWIDIYGTESYRAEDGRLSHKCPEVIFYETGFNVGLSAVAACEAVTSLQGSGKVISFELDEARRPVADKLMAMYPDILTVVWGDSNITVQQYFDKTHLSPHIFFVDGAHTPDKTMRELEVAFSILRPGGLLILDDSLDLMAREVRNSFRPSDCWIEANHQTGLSFLQKGQPWS